METRNFCIVFVVTISIIISGCLGGNSKVEYRCWDGSIATDPDDCPVMSTIEVSTTTSSSTTTTTSIDCAWTNETCQLYCSSECENKVASCELNKKTCKCNYSCIISTTSTTSSTTTTTIDKLLSDADIDKAVGWGEENKFNMSNLLSDYTYPNNTLGYEHVVIYTPYLKLAVLSAKRAREYRKLTDDEVNAIVTSNEIEFKVKIYGDTTSFQKNVGAVIKLRGEIIYPNETKIDDAATVSSYWPESPRYFAVNSYTFDTYREIRNRVISFEVIKMTERKEYEIDMRNYK
ncbi:MAG TPA: hypothetical protein EYP86_04565 [Candidatus Altiarchaeales archaeon]|nr:hypothetical protein [Candidatus Altiarchaeales archaeon]